MVRYRFSRTGARRGPAPAHKSSSISSLIHGVDTAYCVPGESYLAVLDAFL